MSSEAPRLLGRYEIEEEIGRGMMGVVYRARDPVLGRTIALKTVSLAFVTQAEEADGFERRFLTEARVAAALSHPGIVVVHDVGRDAATRSLYIALEYLQGETLADLVKRQGHLPWREAVRIAARVAEALHHAHEAGVVHRDMKPANVMVLPSGEPKIMDFGIAKVAAAQLTSAGEFYGTPLYMSPEQAQGKTVDARSDLFSLGSVLYLLLTGHRPFDAPSVPAILNQVAHHQPAPPSQEREDVPARVDAVLARCLAKAPGGRYQTARDLAADLEALLSGGPLSPLAAPLEEAGEPMRPGASLQSDEPGGPRPAEKRRGRALAGLLVLLASGVLASLFLARGLGSRTAGVPLPAAAAPTPAAAPSHLELSFEHSFPSGTLRVFVDDTLVLDNVLTSRVNRRLRVFKSRRGEVKELLEVAPGEHVVRVSVQSGEFSSARRIRGTFVSGQTRRLQATVEGLVRKELSLTWGNR